MMRICEQSEGSCIVPRAAVSILSLGLVLTFVCAQNSIAANAAHKASGTSSPAIDMNAAWNLYNQRKYAVAADALENLLRTKGPTARLCYYAALANRDSGRSARAKVL